MGFQRAFLFLVLMCATVMVHSQPADIGHRYTHFLRQHVKGDMTIQKCQGVMGYLELTESDSANCKVKNTFIKANSNQVRAICTGGGTPLGNSLFESNNRFPVVICKHKCKKKTLCQHTHPRCEYEGSSSTRKVVIACEREWPVHYGDDILIV
ncbi:ribonuclease-like 3 [Oncorhynchus tshawytscha]|uniref:Ribonuclease A-domain domain-containing protein n=1 Tax=Oncorhynchus tshawytscha TaxID=74940 RepID=A0A8C8CTF1_ONCTS|nr:ribonuclease-like 3 [Oncorhynchus tshawytscha]